MNKINKEVAPSNLEADQKRWNDLLSGGLNKSAAIRFLHAEGWERGRIAKAGGLIYQHVRNVLVKPLKKAVAVEMVAGDIGG